MEKMTATVALKLVQHARENRADWEDMAAACARKGHRPEYCPHGYSQWTDADINCGYCEEDGQGWDYLLTLSHAAMDAKALEARVKERQEIVIKMMALGLGNLDFGDLLGWVNEAWEGWDSK